MGTNIIANQVKTPIQNYFEKVLYENLTFEIPPLNFYFYFIRCSINTDDYTSARTDKINSQNKHKI